MRLFIFLSIATAGLGFAGAQDPQSNEDSPSLRISVNVELVALPVTVRDAKGRPVVDLRERDFEVYENGVRQSVRVFRHEDIPVTVGLVIDHSGSMRPKLAQTIDAARTFVHASNPEDEMFVVNFNERVQVGLPSQVRFTNRFDQLEPAILRAPAAGQTALYDAVFDALTQVGTGAREKRALIVISDGGDNASAHADRRPEVSRDRRRLFTPSAFSIRTTRTAIPISTDAWRTLLEARHSFRKAMESSLTCEDIAHDMRSQYLVGYVPTPTAQHAGYRSIRVTARAAGKGKLSVRTRTGYFAAGDSGIVKNRPSR